MMKAFLLICSTQLAPADCTMATAERFQIIEKQMNQIECLLGSEIAIAEAPDPRLEGRYIKTICGMLDH